MRRNILYGNFAKNLLVTIILLLSTSLSLSGCTDKVTGFPVSTIKNGYYNYIAGGNMACVGDTLYINIKGGSLYLGTYKVSNEGTTKLFTKESVIDYSVNSPIMYQFNDNMYFIDADYDEFNLFDCDSDSLTEDTLDIKSSNGVFYASDDLIVYFSEDAEHVKFKYKYNKEVTLEESVSAFTVYENKIYLITYEGALYCNDPSLLSPECEFISSLNQNGIRSKIIICNGYCYFTDSGSSDTQEGIYRYSFDDDKIELVLAKEILSMNTQGDKVYFATEKGVYFDDSVECTKLTSKKATELYVFDDEWIYLYNQEKGIIYRVSNDGLQTEIID